MTPIRKKYFAYGSNLFAARLQARVPSASAIGVYKLNAHDLRFHKSSHQDGSAKCNALETGNDADFVMGRLFEITETEEPALDQAEGLHHGYEKKTVTVTDAHGTPEKAFTYYATDIDASLRPYRWYKAHVLAGAREAGLPTEYIAKIETVPANKDPNPKRAQREMALHR